MDAKLQEVLLDYGLEGYGLYWYCLELIASNVKTDSLTFELEHDCRVIARNTGSTTQKVQEMMKKFIDIGLFDNCDGRVFCLKLAMRCDDFTAKAVRRSGVKSITSKGVGESQTKSEKVPLEVEVEVEVEVDNKDPIVPSETKRKSKFKFDDDDLKMAKWMYERVKLINPTQAEPNFKDWANTVRLMREVNKYSLIDIGQSFDWANKDSFWCKNVLSPSKLRKQWDSIQAQRVNVVKPSNKQAEQLSPSEEFREYLRSQGKNPNF